MTEIKRPPTPEDISVKDLFDFTGGALPPERMREIEELAKADPEIAARIEFMRLLNPRDEEDEETA